MDEERTPEMGKEEIDSLAQEANRLMAEGDLDEAYTKLKKALEVCENLRKEEDSARRRTDWIQILLQMGNNRSLAGESAEGRELQDRALNQAEAWSRESQDPEMTMAYIICLNNKASVLAEEGDLDGALDSFRNCLQVVRRLVEEHPSQETRYLLTTTELNMAGVYGEKGDLSQALEESAQAVSLGEALVQDFPDPDNRELLLQALQQRGEYLTEMDRIGEAEPLERRAVQLAEQLVENNPSPEYRSLLASSLTVLGNILESTGRVSAALSPYRKAFAILERLCREDENEENLNHFVVLCISINMTEAFPYSERSRAATAGLQALRRLKEKYGEGPWDMLEDALMRP